MYSALVHFLVLMGEVDLWRVKGLTNFQVPENIKYYLKRFDCTALLQTTRVHATKFYHYKRLKVENFEVFIFVTHAHAMI